MGVDINSLISLQTCNFCKSCNQSYFATQGKFEAWIDYGANNKTLQVVVRPYNQTGNASIPPSCKIVVPNFTLSNVLANDGYMYVGFSGDHYEYHNIYSWSFSTSGLPNQKKKSLLILTVLTCGIIFVGGGILGAICFFKTKPQKGLHVVKLGSHGNQDNYDIDVEEFLGGPRRFSYKELSTATKAFSSTEMLGHGEFGCVYKGVLHDTCALVAVKKNSGDSQQGGREFCAEVSIISRVRHCNLVQLQGWCCD